MSQFVFLTLLGGLNTLAAEVRSTPAFADVRYALPSVLVTNTAGSLVLLPRNQPVFTLFQIEAWKTGLEPCRLLAFDLTAKRTVEIIEQSEAVTAENPLES